MADQFNFGQLTKEMIVSRLKGKANAPQAAAEIAKKTIVSGIRATRASGQSPQETLQQICYGAMQGMLLAEGSLPQTTVLILRCMAEIAQELNLDPSELMTWAMEGIAKITIVISQEEAYDIRQAIEEEYHGAGEIFLQISALYVKR